MVDEAPALIQRPQAVQAVFFDAGYTLLSPHPSIVEIARRYCAEHGLQVDPACLESALPTAEVTLRSLVKADPFTWSDNNAIDAIWRQYFTELLRPCLKSLSSSELQRHADGVAQVAGEATSYALYPDVRPVLDTLARKNLTMGVISDWGIGLSLILSHHDLVQYFDFAVISAAIRLAKPDPALFDTALRRANVVPDYAVHIGDSYVLDVLGARAAGITPVLLDRAGAVDPTTLDCLVVRDLFGLLQILDIRLAS
jgi:HAD superfamily hydrolase (TIGR01549 family)